jgi:hypothetical protein
MACSCCLLLGACEEQLPEEKPTAPDLSALVAAYERPELPLDETIVAALVGQVEEQVDAVALLCGWDEAALQSCLLQGQCPECALLSEVLAQLEGLEDESGTEQQSQELRRSLVTRSAALEIGGNTVEGDGFVRVTRICDGWTEGAPLDAEANGELRFIAGFDDVGFDPVVWGDFEGCRMRLGEQNLELALELSLAFPERVAFDSELGGIPVIFSLVGELQSENSTIEVDLDFRATTGLFETRVRSGEQSLVFVAAPQLGFRAANGTWVCTIDFSQTGQSECHTEDGQTLRW